ncbi:MAG: DUF7305 domain-containing protein [Planctomycetota bacterium]|jgi:hypothetical protein
MNINKLLRSKKCGSAVVLVTLVIVLLSLVGLGLLQIGQSSRTLAIRAAQNIKACSTADAGLTKAIYEINEKMKDTKWTDSSLPQATDEKLPSCDCTFSYTIKQSKSSEYSVESTGSSGQAKKTVHATLRLQGPFDSAILVKGNIVMKPGAVVDGYNFTEEGEKLRFGTISTLPAQVTLGMGALVDGDLVVGVGGDPDSVICAPQATITGKTYALTEEVDFPSVTVPQWLEDLPSQGTISEPTTITSSAKYDGINAGQGGIITIDGPVTLYITGNLSLMNSAEIQINNANPNASLTIYLAGDMFCKNGGALNNLTEDPVRLKLFGLDSCTNLSFAATGKFYGGIYAPNAMANFKSSVEIYGAVSAQCFLQGQSANFHYDAALKNVSASDPCVRITVKRWGE